MALLQNRSFIVPYVIIDLVFEEDVHKVFAIHANDIIRVRYNLNGLATEIQGKVTTINHASTAYSYRVNNNTYSAHGVANKDTIYTTNKQGPYIVVDASNVYENKSVNIYLNDILDCDMVYPWKEEYAIRTVHRNIEEKITPIHALRELDGKLQFSSNYGEGWKDVVVVLKDDNIDGVLPIKNGGTGVDKVDDKPIEDSKNFITSGNIYNANKLLEEKLTGTEDIKTTINKLKKEIEELKAIVNKDNSNTHTNEDNG